MANWRACAKCSRTSRLLKCAMASLALTLPAMNQRAHAEDFTPGYWESSGHEILLQITPCGADLCGFIAGMQLDHATDPIALDWRGKSQCGFQMLRVSPTDPASDGQPRWKGVLQDPRNGDVYRTMLKFDSKGNLDLHGYIGVPILGETQVWEKFTGDVPPDCHVPAMIGKQ